MSIYHHIRKTPFGIIEGVKYYLSHNAVLKWIEVPAVYHIPKDELYELDDESFAFLRRCGDDAGCESGSSEFIEYCLDEEILTTDRHFVRRPPLIQSPVPSLRYLELQITDRCNLKCRHCYLGEKGSRELSPESIGTVLREFEEMQGLRVLITGGEPLLHSRFKEVNDMLQDFILRKVLFTNGMLLSDEVLETLRVDEIQVSLDGLRDAHDAIRGTGTFQRTVDAIIRCKKRGLEVSVSTMVHGKNLGDFDGMQDMLERLGVKDWTVDVPCVSGRLKDNPDFQIAPECGGKYLKYGFGSGMHEGASGFGCGLHLMAVMPDGAAAKCTFYSERSPCNIRDGLRACWSAITPVRLEALKCDCEHLESCRGGCRYRAETLGDPFGKDLFRCALYGIIKKKAV